MHQKVKDKAAAGIPIAETLDPNFVQEGSPSLSWLKRRFSQPMTDSAKIAK